MAMANGQHRLTHGDLGIPHFKKPPCGKLEIQGGNQQSKFEIPGNLW